MASMLGLGQALSTIGGFQGEEEKRRDLERQRQMQWAELALRQAQETRMAQGQTADQERARAAQAFDQNFKTWGQTEPGTVVPQAQRKVVPSAFDQFFSPERVSAAPGPQNESAPVGPQPPVDTGNSVFSGFNDPKLASRERVSNAGLQAKQAQFQATLTQRQQLADQRDKLQRELASESNAIRKQQLAVEVGRLNQQIQYQTDSLNSLNWFRQEVTAPAAETRADVSIANLDKQGGIGLPEMLAAMKGEAAGVSGAAATPKSPKVTKTPFATTAPPVAGSPRQQPPTTQSPGPAGGLQVGKPVTLKGKGRVIVTKIYPDGTFDYK